MPKAILSIYALFLALGLLAILIERLPTLRDTDTENKRHEFFNKKRQAFDKMSQDEKESAMKEAWYHDMIRHEEILRKRMEQERKYSQYRMRRAYYHRPREEDLGYDATCAAQDEQLRQMRQFQMEMDRMETDRFMQESLQTSERFNQDSLHASQQSIDTFQSFSNSGSDMGGSGFPF